MFIKDAPFDLTIFLCPYNFRGLAFHFGALNSAYIAIFFTTGSEEVLPRRSSANRKVSVGKALTSYLKVSDGQKQATQLLPPWTELHTC